MLRYAGRQANRVVSQPRLQALSHAYYAASTTTSLPATPSGQCPTSTASESALCRVSLNQSLLSVNRQISLTQSQRHMSTRPSSSSYTRSTSTKRSTRPPPKQKDSYVSKSSSVATTPSTMSSPNTTSGVATSSTSTPSSTSMATQPSKAATRKRASLGDLTFMQMRVAPQVVGALNSLFVKHPSSIQRLAIPALLRRWDPDQKKIFVPPTAAIQDYTGSGKTYAYSIPILSNVNNYIDDKIIPSAVAAALNELRNVPLPEPAEQDLEPLMMSQNPGTVHYGEGEAFTSMTSQDVAHEMKDLEGEDEGMEIEEGEDEEEVGGEMRKGSKAKRVVEAQIVGEENEDDGEIPMMSKKKQNRMMKKIEQEFTSPQSKTTTSSSPSFSSTNNASQWSQLSEAEQLRLKRTASLRKRLREMFPHLPNAALEPDSPASRLQAIIVVPTRELAAQVGKSLESLNPPGKRNRRSNPVITRVLAGGITPNMLADLGVKLKTEFTEEGENTALMGEDNDGNTLFNREMYSKGGIRSQGQVVFGKGHPLYTRDDNAEMTRAQMSDIGSTIVRNEAQQAKEALREARPGGVSKMRLEAVKEQDIKRGLEQEQLQELHMKKIAAVKHAMRESAKEALAAGQEEIDTTVREDDVDRFEHGGREGKKEGQGNEVEGEEGEEMVDHVAELERELKEKRRAKAIKYGKPLPEDDNIDETSVDSMSQVPGRDLLRHQSILRKHKKERDASDAPANNDDLSSSSSSSSTVPYRRLLIRAPLPGEDPGDVELDLEDDDELPESAWGATSTRYKQRALRRTRAELGVGLSDMVVDEKEEDDDDEEEEHGGRLGPVRKESRKLKDLLAWSRDGTIEVNREKQPHVVVGTPELLVKLIRNGALQLPSFEQTASQLKYVVFDELDHLVRQETSPGYKAVMELLKLPADQMVFVSASLTVDAATHMTRLAQREGLFRNPPFSTYATISSQPFFPQAPKMIDGNNKPLHIGSTKHASTASSEPKDVLFLSPDHYREGIKRQASSSSTSLSSTTSPPTTMTTPVSPDDDSSTKTITTAMSSATSSVTPLPAGTIAPTAPATNALPLPPYLRHYYIKVPKGVKKTRFFLEVIAHMRIKYKEDQAKLRALKREAENVQQSIDTSVEVAKAQGNMELAKAISKRAEERKRQIAVEMAEIKFEWPLEYAEEYEEIRMIVEEEKERKRLEEEEKERKATALKRGIQLSGSDVTAALTEGDKGMRKYIGAMGEYFEQQKELNEEYWNEWHGYGEDIGGDEEKKRKMMMKGKDEKEGDGDEGEGEEENGRRDGKPRKTTKDVTPNYSPGNVIAFFNSSANITTSGVQDQLAAAGVPASLFTERSSKTERAKVLLKPHESEVILTTEILARGMDFRELSLVVNVDAPRSPNVYLHRAGRVARMGSTYRRRSVVLSLVEDDDDDNNSGGGGGGVWKDADRMGRGQKKSSDLELLERSAKALGITIRPWPHAIKTGLYAEYVMKRKNLKAKHASKLRRLGLTPNAAAKLAGLHEGRYNFIKKMSGGKEGGREGGRDGGRRGRDGGDRGGRGRPRDESERETSRSAWVSFDQKDQTWLKKSNN